MIYYWYISTVNPHGLSNGATSTLYRLHPSVPLGLEL